LDRALAGNAYPSNCRWLGRSSCPISLWNDGSTGFLKSQVDRIVAVLNRSKAGAPSQKTLMSLPPKSDEASAPDEGTKLAKPREGARPQAGAEPVREEASRPSCSGAEAEPRRRARLHPRRRRHRSPRLQTRAVMSGVAAMSEVAAMSGRAAGGGEERYGQGGGQVVGRAGPRRVAGPQLLEAQQEEARPARRPVAPSPGGGQPRYPQQPRRRPRGLRRPAGPPASRT